MPAGDCFHIQPLPIFFSALPFPSSVSSLLFPSSFSLLRFLPATSVNAAQLLHYPEA
jgi:hypothetical protein